MVISHRLDCHTELWSNHVQLLFYKWVPPKEWLSCESTWIAQICSYLADTWTQEASLPYPVKKVLGILFRLEPFWTFFETSWLGIFSNDNGDHHCARRPLDLLQISWFPCKSKQMRIWGDWQGVEVSWAWDGLLIMEAHSWCTHSWIEGLLSHSPLHSKMSTLALLIRKSIPSAGLQALLSCF